MLTILLPYDPRHDAPHHLAQTLQALVPGAMAGLICDVFVLMDEEPEDIIVDLVESSGGALRISNEHKTSWQAAFAAMRGEWACILPTGAILERNWEEKLREHIMLGRLRAEAAPYGFTPDQADVKQKSWFSLSRYLSRPDWSATGLLMPREALQPCVKRINPKQAGQADMAKALPFVRKSSQIPVTMAAMAHESTFRNH